MIRPGVSSPGFAVEQDLADVLVTECALDEKEQEQNLQKGLTARIGEAATLHAGRRQSLALHVLERGFTDEAIVADALDVQQTVGWPQSR